MLNRLNLPFAGTVLSIAGLATCTLIAFAQPQAEEPVVLTPTKLYELHHELSVREMTHHQEVSEKLNSLESSKAVVQLAYRVTELERKMTGVQKQVTILHAKNESLVKELQKTRDQAAHVAQMLAAKIDKTGGAK